MTPDERAAAEAMKAKVQEIQDAGFSRFRYLLNCKPEDLKHTGFKTVEEGLAFTVRARLKDIEKVQKEFFTKYPDA